MLDGRLLFGFWENITTNTYPVLDACNGHFGVNPNSEGGVVYHYHTTALPPFSAGKFGSRRSGLACAISCWLPNDTGGRCSLKPCVSFAAAV